MGDDERFDYLYKFVSHKKMMPGNSPAARRHNLTLLESGTLYVAKLHFTSAREIDGSGRLPSDGASNGTGQWIRLVSGDRSYVPGMTAAEVLVFTRLAGDAVGATKMDRPEDVEANPVNGRIYAALTNNSARGVGSNPRADEANPRNANKHGHILEITEDGGDHAAETFTWSVPIVCGDPADSSTYFAGYDKRQVSPISCPDNVAFDSRGNLWIATDGNALGSNDGLFATPVEGPERGHLKQFMTVPVGAEACGPFITRDDRSVFLAVQHPGEVDGASLDNPASTWPDGDIPKPAVVCVATRWRPHRRLTAALVRRRHLDLDSPADGHHPATARALGWVVAGLVTGLSQVCSPASIASLIARAVACSLARMIRAEVIISAAGTAHASTTRRSISLSGTASTAAQATPCRYCPTSTCMPRRSPAAISASNASGVVSVAGVNCRMPYSFR